MTEVNDKLQSLLTSSRGERDIALQTFSASFYRTQMADLVLYHLMCTKDFQRRAVSYRGFDVAAGVMAVGPGPIGHRFGRFFGVNVKVDDTDTINIHAEDMAVGKAVSALFPAISVVSVIGPTQEDHKSGLNTSTLHPCGRCRDRLAAHPLITPDTLFVSAREDFTMIDFADLEGIRNLHDEHDPSGVTTFHLSESQDLFAPLARLEAMAPDVEEVNDDEWQRTAGAYLLDRFMKHTQPTQ